MWRRNWQNYEMILKRLKEIFEEKRITFRFDYFTSDSEHNLIRFGSAFNPKKNVRCTFHMLKSQREDLRRVLKLAKDSEDSKGKNAIFLSWNTIRCLHLIDYNQV